MRTLLLSIFCLLAFNTALADRIYILPGTGFSACTSDLSDEIASNGHTVDIASTSATTLPSGFASSYDDPTYGYDWLLLFGYVNYGGIQSQIIDFIHSGGKVLYQYEMYATSVNPNVASLATSITGLSISVSSTVEIASLWTNNQAWRADNVGSCMTLYGNGYRAMDGVPSENQLKATANLNSSSPSYTVNPAFGFVFTASDFPGGEGIGALVALGDVNIWYNGYGTASFGGVPNAAVVDFFFPNSGTSCYLLGEGTPGVGIEESTYEPSINVHPNPSNGNISIELEKSEPCVNVELFDFSGRLVQRAEFKNTSEFDLNIESEAGVYFLQVRTNDYSKKIKVIKE